MTFRYVRTVLLNRPGHTVSADVYEAEDMEHAPYIIALVLGAVTAGGLRWLLGRLFSGPEPDEEEASSPSPPAVQPIEDPDERQTPKPPRPDPATLPDDDPDALEQLSDWGDELLDE